MNTLNLAGKVLLVVLILFFCVLSFAWLLPGTPPKLTNADYFERIGWIVATVVALFLRGPGDEGSP